jgi:hypothetical protein
MLTEVEEELRKNIQRKQRFAVELVKRKADDAENDCEDAETRELDRLTADGVDSGYSSPVTWNSTSACDYQVSDCLVVEDLVDIAAARVL